MTLEEILKNAGLTDEQIQTVIGNMKDNKIYLSDEENLGIRYKKLKEEHETLINQHTEANNLIESLKKNNKDNEELQGKIATYETQVSELQEELTKTKIESAVKVALLAEKAIDVDYLTYKIKEKGDDLKLDDQGNIKGMDDVISGLKTQFPNQFESSSSKKKILEKKLPEDNGDNETKITQEEFDKMGYKSRVELRENNPELYEKFTH